MALVKSKTTPAGVAGNYWRILQTNIHHDRDGVVTLALYVDEQTRQAAQPLETLTIDLGQAWPDGIIPDGVTTARDALLRLAYTTIKTQAQDPDGPLAWFADAADA